MKAKLLVLADGTSVHTQKWIEGLCSSEAWDVFLISMNPLPILESIKSIPQVKGAFKIAPNRVEPQGRNYGYLLNLPLIRKKIREIDPDAITTIYLSSYGLIGSLLKGRARLCHFVVGSDVNVFPETGFLQKGATRLSLKNADFVVSASKGLAEKLSRELGCPDDLILIQQYGVSDQILRTTSDVRDIDLVSNRAWTQNSNIDYFLKILAACETLNVAIVGRIVEGEENLGQGIMEEARKIPGTKVLDFLPYEQNISLVSRSKFLVSLTTTDGASLSVMEGMALGAIPIVSDNSANREWIEHGHNGFLIPLDDFQNAVQRFHEALKIPPDRQKEIIKKNRQIILERGSLSRNMARVTTRLMDLIESERAEY